MKMNRKGFTLVELLMVVIIIGILVTLAVPNYYRSIERAKGGKGKAALDAIRKSQIQYRAYFDSYTGDLNDLTDFDLPTELATGADADWGYATAGDESTFTATATRAAGPYSDDTIVMDQDGAITPGGHIEWGNE